MSLLSKIQELESSQALAKSQQDLLNVRDTKLAWREIWMLDDSAFLRNTQAQVAEMNTLQLQLTTSREEYMKLHA